VLHRSDRRGSHLSFSVLQSADFRNKISVLAEHEGSVDTMPKRVAEEAVVSARSTARPAAGRLFRICAAGWLIPGCGHLLLGRRWRALILFASILTMFLFGLAMKGDFFWNSSDSYLQKLGWLSVWCVGAPRWVAGFFGYSGGDPFFVSADYGTAFLVAAGMLNLLAILDAYDIAMERKQ
jgi:hypothetical protein